MTVSNVARTWLGALAVVAVVGCDRNSDGNGSRRVAVLTAAIRDVTDNPPTSDPAAPLPIVYVVAVGENEVAATVQADVVAGLQDEIDVRFADEREEAVQSGEDGAPVHDDGVLLVVGDIPSDGDPIDVEMEVYRSEQDRFKVIATLDERPTEWNVTATSQVTLDAS